MPRISKQKKEAVRLDILNAARKVFIDKGYEAASMRDIVTSSGRSFGGVYLYYSNKEDVFLALLRHQYEEMAQDFGSENQLNVWNAFEQFMTEQERRVKEADRGLAPCMYEYFIVGRREENRRKLIEERYQGVFASIIALLDEGVRRGSFVPRSPWKVSPIGSFRRWTVFFWKVSSMVLQE